MAWNSIPCRHEPRPRSVHGQNANLFAPTPMQGFQPSDSLEPMLLCSWFESGKSEPGELLLLLRCSLCGSCDTAKFANQSIVLNSINDVCDETVFDDNGWPVRLIPVIAAYVFCCPELSGSCERNKEVDRPAALSLQAGGELNT